MHLIDCKKYFGENIKFGAFRSQKISYAEYKTIIMMSKTNQSH